MRTLYDFFHKSVRCDRHLLTVIYPSTVLFILSSCTKVYQYIMIFIWPFLPLFRPLERHNGQVFLGLPDLTIVQNPHAQCANHETHSVMQHTGYRPLCPFCCQNLGKPRFIIQFGMSLHNELILYQSQNGNLAYYQSE
jgi:hypothetical protein